MRPSCHEGRRVGERLGARGRDVILGLRTDEDRSARTAIGDHRPALGRRALWSPKAERSAEHVATALRRLWPSRSRMANGTYRSRKRPSTTTSPSTYPSAL